MTSSTKNNNHRGNYY